MVIQSDVFPEQHASVVVCRMTSRLEDAPDFRLTIEPSRANGLWEISWIIADKPVTVRRERIGSRIGRLDRRDMTRLNNALAFVRCEPRLLSDASPPSPHTGTGT